MYTKRSNMSYQFYKTPTFLMGKGLSGVKIFLHTILANAYVENNCKPFTYSSSRLAKKLNCHENTVNKYVADFVKRGLLTKKSRRYTDPDTNQHTTIRIFTSVKIDGEGVMASLSDEEGNKTLDKYLSTFVQNSSIQTPAIPEGNQPKAQSLNPVIPECSGKRSRSSNKYINSNRLGHFLQKLIDKGVKTFANSPYLAAKLDSLNEQLGTTDEILIKAIDWNLKGDAKFRDMMFQGRIDNGKSHSPTFMFTVERIKAYLKTMKAEKVALEPVKPVTKEAPAVEQQRTESDWLAMSLDQVIEAMSLTSKPPMTAVRTIVSTLGDLEERLSGDVKKLLSFAKSGFSSWKYPSFESMLVAALK